MFLNVRFQANIIHVVQKGKIVESGSHEKLMKQGGAYYQLNSQQSWNFLWIFKIYWASFEKTFFLYKKYF